MPINPNEYIYAFPTHSPQLHECCWSFYHHIRSIITFNQYKTLEKQLQRASYCIVRFSRPFLSLRIKSRQASKQWPKFLASACDNPCTRSINNIYKRGNLSTFERMLRIGNALSLFTTYNTNRKKGGQSHNVYVFLRFDVSNTKKLTHQTIKMIKLIKQSQKLNKF
ncbi:competence protein ComK [Alkalihalobacillus sp. MEB130]|uniref:competence protein ComK n=1 Tax=Alkalihalobacillus sp. MEB130 TaxID=2976704 RepID=UPI0028E02AF3|nr:competence protein ComK [Alkalihalobacillus sp. MEB130]MDT8860303.1 competence protein ComK [Alkalihalobacillus sp. MEB130]